MNALISMINTVIGNPLNEKRQEQTNERTVCNYQNNYYGDQVCIIAED